jgi:hypothetical protein
VPKNVWREVYQGRSQKLCRVFVIEVTFFLVLFGAFAFGAGGRVVGISVFRGTAFGSEADVFYVGCSGLFQ